MNWKKTTTNGIWRAAAVAVLLLVATSVIPVAALEFPDFRHFYIKPANSDPIRFNATENGTYYFKLEGGGLNALHITENSEDYPYGQVTTTQSRSDSFRVSDTGGRGFFDDVILLVAVNGSAQNLTDFSITIESSGYTWPPTGQLNEVPSEAMVQSNFTTSAISETFTSADFYNFTNSTIPSPGQQIVQDWKLSTLANYPVFSGENLESTANNFRFIFVDLGVGIIGTNVSYHTDLIDYGAANVEYTLADPLDPDTFVAFNVYGWCNQSNQGQGISWTNRVNTSAQTGSDASGWLVRP